MSVNGFDFDGTVHRYNYNSLDNIPPNIAPAYSASSTYAVGDYCTKDNVLYKCSTAISTAEAWNSAHWTQVQLATDVADLKDEISEIEPGLSDDAKAALLNCFAHVKWSDGHGKNYYDSLREALGVVDNPFESAVYDFGGWGFSTFSGGTSTGYLVNRNELTKRAGCVAAIPCASGSLVAKPGYLVTLHPLTSNKMETVTISGQQKQVYVDVIYTESSQYITDTSLDIPAGTKYVCLTLRKENDGNFTQNEIDNLYGTVFEYEEVTV